jgi:hypothetical protein
MWLCLPSPTFGGGSWNIADCEQQALCREVTCHDGLDSNHTVELRCMQRVCRPLLNADLLLSSPTRLSHSHGGCPGPHTACTAWQCTCSMRSTTAIML